MRRLRLSHWYPGRAAGIFVLGIRPVALAVQAGFSGPRPESFVGRFPGEGAGAVGLGDHVAAAVVEIVAGLRARAPDWLSQT